MPSILLRFSLFLSSYFPLTLIFFVLFVEKNVWESISILALGLVGLAGMLLYIKSARRFNSQSVRIDRVQRRDSEAMSYVVSYIIPFLSVPFSGWQQGLALGVFFVMLAILYVNSGMIHINPTLNLMGFHIYEVDLPGGESASLIARHRVRKGDTVRVVKADDEILLVVES